MENYLDAECVINGMIKHGIISDKDKWKNINPLTKYYSETFEVPGTRNVVVLQINVVGSRLCVSVSSIKIIAARQKFDAGNILTTCKI
jgi:hypothetical protein